MAAAAPGTHLRQADARAPNIGDRRIPKSTDGPGSLGLQQDDPAPYSGDGELGWDMYASAVDDTPRGAVAKAGSHIEKNDAGARTEPGDKLPLTSTCSRRTEGTCGMFGCSKYRNAQCINKLCVCGYDQCAQPGPGGLWGWGRRCGDPGPSSYDDPMLTDLRKLTTHMVDRPTEKIKSSGWYQSTGATCGNGRCNSSRGLATCSGGPLAEIIGIIGSDGTEGDKSFCVCKHGAILVPNESWDGYGTCKSLQEILSYQQSGAGDRWKQMIWDNFSRSPYYTSGDYLSNK